MHAKDESPVSYERVASREGKPVEWEDLVKGYETRKGRFVVVTKDDFKTAASRRRRRSTSSTSWIPDDIDERYFETPYYLQPGKGADRAYALLREAIRDVRQIGIAQDHPARRPAPGRGRNDQGRARPDDDALRG